jgi:hypothetical protein
LGLSPLVGLATRAIKGRSSSPARGISGIMVASGIGTLAATTGVAALDALLAPLSVGPAAGFRLVVLVATLALLPLRGTLTASDPRAV